ncbi:hypothetical protein SISNIDRAFT_482653 [Sistotremastrum niveocremeum HHB9708]|uniref:Uncharacterized protein n=1 Tax=Sistotremastrum niveocremeum HHB9708 TaxID=1314777 RepID=A0A164YFX1_9AGAM|nr:hypothetical protein SISNIDRAFT_482653 [Sistotremastrum niveocremeum HHB9708]
MRPSVSTSAAVGGSSPRHAAPFDSAIFDITKLPIQTRDLEWVNGENVEGRMLLRMAEQVIASGCAEPIKRVVALMNEVALDPAAETPDSLQIMRKVAADLRSSIINGSLPFDARADTRSFLLNCVTKLSSKILSTHDKEFVVESVGLAACVATQFEDWEESFALLKKQVILPVSALCKEFPDSPEKTSLLPPLSAALSAFWLSPLSQQRHASVVTDCLIRIICFPGNNHPYESTEQCLKYALMRLRNSDSVSMATSLVNHLIRIAHEKHDAGERFSFKFLLKVIGALEAMKSAGWNFAEASLVDVWASSVKCGVKIIARTFPHLPKELQRVVNAQVFGRCGDCNEAIIERVKHAVRLNDFIFGSLRRSNVAPQLNKVELRDLRWWVIKVGRLWKWFCAVADEEIQKEALDKQFHSARRIMGWRDFISHDHSHEARLESTFIPRPSTTISLGSTIIDFDMANGSNVPPSHTPSSILQSRPSTGAAHIHMRQRVSSASTLASVPEDSEERLEALAMPPTAHHAPQAPFIPTEAHSTLGTRQHMPTVVGVLSSTSRSNTRYWPIRPSYPQSAPATPSSSRRSKQRSQSNPLPSEIIGKMPLNDPSSVKPNPLKRGHSSSSSKENDRDYKNKRARTSLDLSLMKSPSSRDPSQAPASSDSLSFFQKLTRLGSRRRKSTTAHSATTQPEAAAGPSRIPSLDTSLLPAFNLPEVPATPRRTHDHAACSLYTPQVPGSIYHIEDRLRHDNGWVQGLTKLWFDSTAPAEDVDVRGSQEFVWHSEQPSGEGQHHPVASSSAIPVTNHSIAGHSTEESEENEENETGTRSAAGILSTHSTPTHRVTRMSTPFFGSNF